VEEKMVIRKLKIYHSASELFHTAPTLKPPRFDLRKRKVLDDPDIDVDVDLEDTSDSESDDDLIED
jgi:hypothetical protein